MFLCGTWACWTFCCSDKTSSSHGVCGRLVLHIRLLFSQESLQPTCYWYNYLQSSLKANCCCFHDTCSPGDGGGGGGGMLGKAERAGRTRVGLQGCYYEGTVTVSFPMMFNRSWLIASLLPWRKRGIDRKRPKEQISSIEKPLAEMSSPFPFGSWLLALVGIV